MRIAAFYFPTDYGIDPGELARELEGRGFESLFLCEHTHIPVSRRTCLVTEHDPIVAAKV